MTQKPETLCTGCGATVTQGNANITEQERAIMEHKGLFNYNIQKFGDKFYLTAARWREGLTVPEGVIVREISEDEAEAMAS